MRTRLIAKTVCVQLLLASCVTAFSTTSLWAAPCVIPPASPESIDQFKAKPEALVTVGADARTVEASVRDLAGTDANLASDFVRLAEATTPRFRTAIAAGLAQAAIACANLDQHAALIIQQAVAGFEDGEFQASFAAVSGDISTAAADAAAASATSSVGSVIIVNPNSSPRPSTASGGGGTTLSQITTVAVRTPKTPTTSTTAANPVSATR